MFERTVGKRLVDDGDRVSKATLTAQVEIALRQDIIEGILVPGQRLRAGDLASTYGVSATPLREALNRLAALGLIRLDPRLGATVAPISDLDLRDVYWLRSVLEGTALERSIELGDAAWEARVRTAYEALKEATALANNSSRSAALDWAEAHRAFHAALFSACGSPWLLRFVSTLRDHSQRYVMLSVRSHLPGTLSDHTAIYRAAVGREKDPAVRALRSHFEGVVQRVEAEFLTRESADEQETPVP